VSHVFFTHATGSSSRTQNRLRLDTVDDDGATLTITGNGEALDMTGADWTALQTFGDIIFTGDAITFSDSARGGTISCIGADGVIRPCTMVFSNSTGSISLGNRAGATLSLGHMGLSVRAGQVWTADTNACVSLSRNGTRSILDSPDTNRLDNLGQVDIQVDHIRYGVNSILTLRGGTYGSLDARGGGNRTFQITLQDSVAFAGRFPNATNGLRLDKGVIDTAGHDVSALDGDLYIGGGASIRGGESSFFINGSIRNQGSGINGNSNTVVSLTGDMDNQGPSTTGSGLYLSTVNAVGGGTAQRFEVGDDSAQAEPAAASFSIGTLNVGLGSTNAVVKLVNDVRNDNPIVATNETDRIGEKLVVGTLNVNAGSTLDVNGQNVRVNALTVAPDAWLDLDMGRRLVHSEILTNFVAPGDLTADWNAFADRVKDSSNPLSSFVAIRNTTETPTPAGGTSRLAFDGVDDYVEIGADGLGTGPISAFTVECWLRVTRSTGGWGYAVHRSKDANVGSSIYWLGVHGTDDLSYGAAVNGKHASGDTGVPIDADWHHLAVAYDGTNQWVYLDGVQKAGGNIGPIGNQLTGNRIGIGSTSYNAASRPVGGNIAELRIWDHARSADEIMAAKDVQLAGTESGLVGYWPLDDGFGTTVRDASANDNAGTLKNGLTWDGGETTTFWKVVGPYPCTVILIR
jgi:hypothetical protein